jgi:hypothetical protein
MNTDESTRRLLGRLFYAPRPRVVPKADERACLLPRRAMALKITISNSLH